MDDDEGGMEGQGEGDDYGGEEMHPSGIRPELQWVLAFEWLGQFFMCIEMVLWIEDMDHLLGRNIVATVNLGCQLNLKTIAMHARNAEYNPKRFAAVIMRIRFLFFLLDMRTATMNWCVIPYFYRFRRFQGSKNNCSDFRVRKNGLHWGKEWGMVIFRQSIRLRWGMFLLFRSWLGWLHVNTPV